MNIDSIKFKGHRCFKNDWVGFETIKSINVIIGRNNTGKSHLLDLARVCTHNKIQGQAWDFQCTGVLDEESLKREFQPGTSGGGLGFGDHWLNHGQNLVDQNLVWECNGAGNPLTMYTSHSDYIRPEPTQAVSKEYYVRGSQIAQKATPPLAGSSYKHLLADRDISPEAESEGLDLTAAGRGATNIIRRFLMSSDSENLPRGVIMTEVLDALNRIFGNDGRFTEITVQYHDHQDASHKNAWEIYLGEDSKGIVPLSNSGSGLKTVLLVLLNMIALPVIEKNDPSNYVFAFEELENNLHPALLRRLFQYIEDYAQKNGATFFLTTHSSVALDFFGLSDQAQIIHVKHDGESASASVVSAHFDKIGLIGELGAKPSDILQANGIIWVEGPSDRIYINRWIELVSEGELQEGRDYQCAFYGGALLARTEAKAAEEEEAEENRVNLLRVNPNIYLVCDGDRDGPKKPLKGRVQRIEEEVSKIPNAGFWATQGREIENYVPGSIISQVRDTPDLPDPEQCEQFFGSKRSKRSYLQDHQQIRTLDKTQFAVECVKLMTFENMKERFDWEEKVTEIVQAIRKWNA